MPSISVYVPYLFLVYLCHFFFLHLHAFESSAKPESNPPHVDTYFVSESASASLTKLLRTLRRLWHVDVFRQPFDCHRGPPLSWS